MILSVLVVAHGKKIVRRLIPSAAVCHNTILFHIITIGIVIIKIQS